MDLTMFGLTDLGLNKKKSKKRDKLNQGVVGDLKKERK